MQPKPEDYRTYFADTFKDQRVVDAYRYRPPYPEEVFDILANLITDEPRAVLDVGAGSGDIARNVVDFVERVDAVDFSQHMIERGKQLPNGNAPQLHWIYGKVEEVQLTPPYTLITAGSSIHWLEWKQVFPLFRSILTPHGYLALVYRKTLPRPWDAEVSRLRAHFLPQAEHRSAPVDEELEARGFFQKQGVKETAPLPFFQSIDDFIESLHSHFSPEHMGHQQAADFDQQMRTLLLHYHQDGILPLQVVGLVMWGTPERGLTNGRTD